MRISKIVLLLCICCTLLFTSCGSTETSTKKVVEDGSYTMTIPQSWYIIDDTSLKTALPEGSYRAARATLAIQGIYPKLTITKETLLIPTTSLSYAEANIAKAPLVSTQYTKLEARDLELNKQKTRFHIFTAKATPESPLLLYLQTHIIKDEHYAYTISFSTTPTEKNYDKYLTYIKTFEWK